LLTWITEKRNVADLNPAPYNPRKWPDKETKDLEVSLERFNLADPIIINKNNTIIGGHFRVQIYKNHGKTCEVDCRVPSRLLTEHEEKELNLRLNRNLGQWDFDSLANFDEDMLKDVGFDSKELDRIFQLDARPDDDDVPEKPPAITRLGDLYQLGRHRLLCGDSTKQEDVARLMDGKQADMVFTDPPYNVNYSGCGKETSTTIENDDLSEGAFRQFLCDAFNNYQAHLKANGAMYVCYASRTHREFEDAVNAAGFEVKNQIIWVKLVASMGWGDYRWKHEPILYCRRRSQKSDFYGDRSQYTTWEEEKSDEELLKYVKSLIKKDENGNSTVWRFHRESQYKHPTQKPVALVEKAIANSSTRGSTVLDLFLGSGSTLITCEKTNRICYGMEIDPVYCDVIVKRWEDYTNQKAVKQ